VESSFTKYFVMKLNNPYIFVNEHYTSQMCPNCKETKTILKEECGFRINFCNECGICFHRDIMAAENMVNKGMSQIKDDPAIASNLDAVSVSKHNEDYDAGSSGSQKKNSADLDLNQG